jgi:hypothetical protein
MTVDALLASVKNGTKNAKDTLIQNGFRKDCWIDLINPFTNFQIQTAAFLYT